MQSPYLVLLWYASTSPLSRLIRWVSRSPYSHVAIVANGIVYESVARGVVKHDGWAALDRMGQAAAWQWVPASAADVNQAQAWLEAHVGKRYSRAGFIAAGVGILTGFRIVLAGQGRYICSGLAATALQIAGYLVAHEARLETPASLADIFGAEVAPWVVP